MLHLLLATQEGREGDAVGRLGRVGSSQFAERGNQIREVRHQVRRLAGLDDARPMGDERDADADLVQTALVALKST
jgi:hypothetical protein